MPVLLYGLEALDLSKSERSTIDFVYSTIFFKIFNVKENRTIKQCQFYSGCLPTSYRLDLKKYNFLNGIKCQKNSIQWHLFTWFGNDEQLIITSNYSILPKDNVWEIKRKFFNYLESEIN